MEDQTRAEAERLGILFWADLRERTPHWGFVERVPIEFARKHAVMAFAGEAVDFGQDAVVLAIGGPERWPQADVVRRFLRRPVQPVFAPEEQILGAINHAYQQRSGQAVSLVEVLDAKDLAGDLEDPLGEREDLLENRGSPPIIRLVNSILFEAVKARASDVHVQPQEESVIVLRYILGSETKSKSCTSMFVFIRPVILRDDKFRDLKFVSERDVRAAGEQPHYPESKPIWVR